MIADRAQAMMATVGEIPELEARGAFSGDWKDLPERRISFHFYTERYEEFLDYGSFCMKCGGRPLVEGALDFYPWHLLGVTAFFYTVDTKGGAELFFYDPDCWCDVVYLEPVPDTGKMVLTVRKNRDYDNPDENVCPVKFRCLVDREMFLQNFRKALSKKVSDPSLEKWIRPRVNGAFDEGLDREEKLAQVRKAEELVAGVAAVENDYGKHELYEEQYEDLDAVAAVLREVNIIRQDPWAVGEPLPVRKLEEFID